MNFIEYTYLVHYGHKNGAGRSVLKCTGRITCYADVKKVEKAITDCNNNKLENIGVLSFQLLNWGFVWPFSKELEPVCQKQPEPRPYNRQVFANGIWQGDLPADNSEALVMILDRFDQHNGFIEIKRGDTSEDVLLSDGCHNRNYFFRKVSQWLDRNPGV